MTLIKKSVILESISGAAAPGGFFHQAIEIEKKLSQITRIKRIIWTYAIFCSTNGVHYNWLEPGLDVQGFLEIISSGAPIARPADVKTGNFADSGEAFKLYSPGEYNLSEMAFSPNLKIFVSFNNNHVAFTRVIQGNIYAEIEYTEV